MLVKKSEIVRDLASANDTEMSSGKGSEGGGSKPTQFN